MLKKMQIEKQYLQKYLQHIAIDQLTAQYQQKGYVVLKEPLDSYQPDVAFKNDYETIVIEVVEGKAGKLTAEKKERIDKLHNYVQNHAHHKFLIVLATPPKDKKLEIDGFDSMLLTYFMKKIPAELIQLSTYARVKKILSTNIDTISVAKQGVLVIGEGVISVDLEFRSDAEQNVYNKHLYEHFLFDFELLMNYNSQHLLEISEVRKMKVDTSVYD
jgi:REase_AHJR-like